MIDALLGEEGEEGKEEMLHCSLDSIDRLGDSLTQFEKARWKAGPLLQFIVSRLPLDNGAEPGLVSFKPGLFTVLQICVANNSIHSFPPVRGQDCRKGLESGANSCN